MPGETAYAPSCGRGRIVGINEKPTKAQIILIFGWMAAKIIWSIVAVIWLLVDTESGLRPVGAIFGVIVAADLIRMLVRWISRRDDPRLADRPSGAP